MQPREVQGGDGEDVVQEEFVRGGEVGDDGLPGGFGGVGRGEREAGRVFVVVEDALEGRGERFACGFPAVGEANVGGYCGEGVGDYEVWEGEEGGRGSWRAEGWGRGEEDFRGVGSGEEVEVVGSTGYQ